jgi:hypothetical protein
MQHSDCDRETLYVSLAFQLQPGDEDLERQRGDRVDFDGSDTVLENLGELGGEGFEEESVDLESLLLVLCAVVCLPSMSISTLVSEC